MDPAMEAASMVELRSRFLGLAPSPVSSGRDDASGGSGREMAVNAVRRLRSRIWELPPHEARVASGELALKEFPDLKMAAVRLERIASLRSCFDEASQRADPAFMEAFRQIVAAPGDEAVVMKDKFLRKLAPGKPFRRARESAKIIKRRFPELFALEADWLSLIIGLQKERKLVAHVKKSWWRWIVAFILFRLIVKAFGE